jgi:hypothetical protein
VHLKNLGHNNAKVRQSATKALKLLGKIATPQVIDVHLENLRHKDAKVRQSAYAKISAMNRHLVINF